MDFEGVVSKDGAGVGVWVLNSKTGIEKGYSYKINFHCTNNVAEYQTLILGLKILMRSRAKRIYVYGD